MPADRDSADGAPALYPPGLQLYAEEVRRLPAPGDAEARIMVARVRSGDRDALRQILVRHLALVVELVERQPPRDCDDALAALETGNLALVQAAQSFNPATAESFEAFARRQVQAALSGGMH
ncbi:MAG: hypothetical protein JXL80_02845 [Planctomycetes bacterium]|nr:hypothetical protein [Planctomycetota bacterium]